VALRGTFAGSIVAVSCALAFARNEKQKLSIIKLSIIFASYEDSYLPEFERLFVEV